MDKLVVSVANLVEARLKEAKDEISKGQKKIADYVTGLPRDLQAVGKAAEREVADRFEELRQGVDDKKNDLAQKLAQQYKDASDKSETAIKKLQEEDKGLATRLKEAIGEVIRVLRDFKNRILSLLKKAAAAIDIIVSDPIGFLSNLLSAV